MNLRPVALVVKLALCPLSSKSPISGDRGKRCAKKLTGGPCGTLAHVDAGAAATLTCHADEALKVARAICRVPTVRNVESILNVEDGVGDEDRILTQVEALWKER